MRRTGLTVVTLAAAVLGWLLLAAPTTLGGSTTYVRVHGISMEPRFHTGDLAILRQADQYEPGDVVAYRSQLLGTAVMHRIVEDRDGHYTFKGDNNSWLDPEHPTRADLIGRLVVRVPHGGTWLARLASPPYLAAAAVLLLSAGGTAARSRHRRKRRPMARHASRSSRPASLAVLPAQLRVAAALTAATAVVGTVLAALAWAGPVQTAVSGQQPSGRSMVFSYTATVPASAAYDTTTVTSPDPIFRKLTNTITVRYAYTGGPGTLRLDADLSTPAGWRSTMAITPRTAFTTDGYQGSARLNLDTLDARAQAAAAATGIPATQVDVAIVATVSTPGAGDFTPRLQLALTPLQLTLAGDGKGLTVADAVTVPHTTGTPRTLPVLGHQLGVSTARTLGAALLLVAVFAAAVLLVVARRLRPLNEAAAIRARYGSLLVPIHPMSTPAGQQIVDVTDFITLARLAERTGLLILHWSRSDVATFVIQDEATTYRYRTGSTGAAPDQTWLDFDAPIDA